MSHHYAIANITKKEYIDCPDSYCNEVGRFWKKEIHKCFFQDFLEILIDDWAGDEIQVFCGFEESNILKNLKIVKNFYDEYARIDTTECQNSNI